MLGAVGRGAAVARKIRICRGQGSGAALQRPAPCAAQRHAVLDGSDGRAAEAGLPPEADAEESELLHCSPADAGHQAWAGVAEQQPLGGRLARARPHPPPPEDVAPPAPRSTSSSPGPLLSFPLFAFFADRVRGDPRYPQKLVVELGVDLGCSSFAEIASRGSAAFGSQRLYVIDDLATTVLLDVLMVSLLTPAVPVALQPQAQALPDGGGPAPHPPDRPPSALAARLAALRAEVAALPPTAFAVVGGYSLAQRLASAGCTALSYAVYGLVCGGLGQEATNALAAAQHMQATPVLPVALLWADYSAIKSRSRPAAERLLTRHALLPSGNERVAALRPGGRGRRGAGAHARAGGPRLGAQRPHPGHATRQQRVWGQPVGGDAPAARTQPLTSSRCQRAAGGGRRSGLRLPVLPATGTAGALRRSRTLGVMGDVMRRG